LAEERDPPYAIWLYSSVYKVDYTEDNVLSLLAAFV